MVRRGALGLAAVVLTASCASGSAAPAGNDRLRLVTTVAPITSITASVVGDLADVTGLVPEGTNSHTFEPPPSAARALSRADVVFVNGLRLEEPTEDLARANLRDGAEVVRLGDRTITPAEYLYDFSFPKEGGKPNPHLWTDPPLALRYAEVVADVVSRRDPANAERYRANLDAFRAKVSALDAAMVTATKSVAPTNRALLTYHDAYAYFAKHYGWRVIGAIQPSSFAEPSAREVAALITQIRASGVPAIFGSEVFPSRVLAQIGRESGVKYVDVLRDDDLPGKPGDAEHSWLGLMRFDFVTMVESLGGDATALRAIDSASTVADRAEYPQ